VDCVIHAPGTVCESATIILRKHKMVQKSAIHHFFTNNFFGKLHGGQTKRIIIIPLYLETDMQQALLKCYRSADDKVLVSSISVEIRDAIIAGNKKFTISSTTNESHDATFTKEPFPSTIQQSGSMKVELPIRQRFKTDYLEESNMPNKRSSISEPSVAIKKPRMRTIFTIIDDIICENNLEYDPDPSRFIKTIGRLASESDFFLLKKSERAAKEYLKGDLLKLTFDKYSYSPEVIEMVSASGKRERVRTLTLTRKDTDPLQSSMRVRLILV